MSWQLTGPAGGMDTLPAARPYDSDSGLSGGQGNNTWKQKAKAWPWSVLASQIVTKGKDVRKTPGFLGLQTQWQDSTLTLWRKCFRRKGVHRLSTRQGHQIELASVRDSCSRGLARPPRRRGGGGTREHAETLLRGRHRLRNQAGRGRLAWWLRNWAPTRLSTVRVLDLAPWGVISRSLFLCLSRGEHMYPMGEETSNKKKETALGRRAGTGGRAVTLSPGRRRGLRSKNRRKTESVVHGNWEKARESLDLTGERATVTTTGIRTELNRRLCDQCRQAGSPVRAKGQLPAAPVLGRAGPGHPGDSPGTSP